MADLDVTEILDDEDFSDVVTCLRGVQTVGSNGLASVVQTSTDFVAVVTNGGGDSLIRDPGGSRTSGDILVHSTFLLVAGSDTNDADIIVWKGRRYTVVNVSDWSHFGPGFTAASCELIPLRG